MNYSLAVLISAALLIAYTWLGYPVLLLLLRLKRNGVEDVVGQTPTVSIIIAAYNEDRLMAAKLEDTLAQDYPKECFEIIVASDGSTDATEQIVEAFANRDARVRLVRSAGRAGKSGVQNLAAEHAHGDILLFTDVETTTKPDLLRLVVSRFADPAVGLVAPAVLFGRADSAVSKGQGAYWRFELFLRQLESDLGILATASGSAFAIRRNLFRPIPSHYGDDCIVPLDVRLQGYRVIQDRHITVWDEMPHTVHGELRARIRMTARNWTGILSRSRLLNPLRFPGTAWSLLSHKFMRWMTPVFLLIFLLANVNLALHDELRALLVLQLCFYFAAVIGWRQSLRDACGPMLGYPFAFCLANLGFFLGIMKCLRGNRIVAYK